MKKLFFIILFSLNLYSVNVEDLTYDVLYKSDYTDHVQHFNKIFQGRPVGRFLEFGLGYGTKFFLDHCDHVTSCEILVPGQNDHWFRETQNLLRKYQNWQPLLKWGSVRMGYANDLSLSSFDPSLYDAAYLLEIKDICDELFENASYDVAFVDAGFHMRGDIVNELFDRVPVIAAHDTNGNDEIWGWTRVHTPSNYVKIVCKEGMGVTFWVRKDQTEIIHRLGSYSQTQKKHLRIFFPQMHHTLVQSMANALHYLGHTLVLPGESFHEYAPNCGPKLRYGTFFKKNPLESVSYTSYFSPSPDYCSFLLKNVEVVENEEDIIAHPPDVLVVNCDGLEQDLLVLWRHLEALCQRSIKLIHYSGNNDTPYLRQFVKNLIATDAYTARNYDPKKINCITWIPWMDFAGHPFEGVSDEGASAYLPRHHPLFKNSVPLFSAFENQWKRDFPKSPIQEYPGARNFIPHEEMFSLINNSSALIHIKDIEGFGYTIIESLMKGRPVFLKRSYSLGSRLMNWCIEGKTAFFFDDYAEFKQKLDKFLTDAEFRHAMQRESARTIRRLINNEKQARILDQFLQNLQ